MKMRLVTRVFLLALVIGTTASFAMASFLTGTQAVSPGTTVIPPLVSSTGPGTLLASLVSPYSFSTTAGTTNGTLTTAVYRNGSGTLDFWYQVSNSANSSTAITRETDVSFAGFQTAVGFATTAFGPFVTGTVAPTTADSSASGPGSTIGFEFGPPDSYKIAPGQTSDVFVISTDATLFTTGKASIIDGGSQTVAAFEPATVQTPEPGSLLLLGSGGLALLRLARRKFRT